MKITNKYGLPDAIVNAMKAQRDDYNSDRGNADISVTRLIDPPQIDALTRQHADKITEDASDRLWALMGTAMHNILEKAKTEALVEERLYMPILDWTVSGKYDRMLVGDGLLQDYKFASVWEAVYGIKPERVAQLNCLAHLARHNGHTIHQIEVVMLFRDWSATKARTDASYPQSQITRIKVELWTADKAQSYMEERVRLHMAARAGNVIHCTDEERWASGHKWAIMKKGRKSALKLCDSENEAHQYLMERGLTDADNVHSIVFRSGEFKRCQQYCAVADFCPQWRHDREDA